MSFKKKEKLQWTADRLDSSAFLLFIQYFNYDTIQWKAFRKELSSHNLGLIVIKANMFKSYFKDTPYASLNPTFSGPMANRCLDVFHNFPSTPGVFDPLLCVTFRIAIARPQNERSNDSCRSFSRVCSLLL
jgi:hypothetical protein